MQSTLKLSEEVLKNASTKHQELLEKCKTFFIEENVKKENVPKFDKLF
jgi:hypothetical protein